MFSKGSGTTFSIDTLTLNPDNISSGRKKLGMLVYVKDQDQVYQFNINNYETLWNAATGATGIGGATVVISDFGTTVKANSPQGIAFISGWTANTIDGISGETQSSAVWKKYYGSNLSLTGGTYSGGTLILTNITGGTTSISGFGTGSSGDYLPLSGGTVTGGTIFTSGVTANTISNIQYIDFTTGSTNPSAVGGRVFFDNYAKSLSYYDIFGNNVAIAMGQQLFVRVNNATGSQINKGKVIAITGTTNSLPSAILATNNHATTSARPIGLAAEDISNGSDGLVIVNGILSGITLNTFANGDVLYLSDTVPGGYVSSTSALSFTARTNEIGYVIQTGTTTGKIYVTINNEDSNLTLTDIERNILEGNVISGGIYQYTGMTQGTGQTINVALARGWVVKNTYQYATLPDVTNVYYTGGTNIPLTYLSSADATYILITSASTLLQQTTFPTPQQRRENIFIGKVVHPNRSTITSINQTVDFDVSPMAAIRDLWTPLKLINQGVVVSANGVNMNINSSAGTLWGNGIGWTTNQQNPDSISMSGQSPVTFQYRTQLGPLTGGTVATGNTTTINPAYYDNNGVVTAVGGGSNSSTNQRIYMFPTGLIRIQLGQTVYGSLAAAVAGVQTEQFVEYGNNRDNGILIGILSVNKNASVGNGGLVNTSYAVFNFVSKFGEVLGGTGGLSTTTLQQAYDNSSTPEIVINATLDGLSIKNGTGNADNVTNILEGLNTAGSTTSFIRADGGISGSSISAVTYYNLPTDIRVTGATYSNNTFTYRNNTGGTFNVLFNTVTGLTVNGNLTVTGTTTSGNGSFTKAGFATGDVLLDNNGTDTPGVLFYYANNSNYGIDSWNGSFDVLSGQLIRITNKLNETGGSVKLAIDTTGNMVVTGFVKANAWRAGQVINDIMLSNTEVTVSTTTIATSNSDTDFVTYSYTPLSSTSYLVIHYHLASFSFEGGTGNDSYFSRIKVDGGEITYSKQSTVNGNRTGVLFPLTGRYTNSNTTSKSIVVACRRDSADDSITIVNTSTSMWLRITEIAR
jgi:hypothetical protein